MVAQWLESFRRFPPRQKPASFNRDAVMEKLMSGSARQHELRLVSAELGYHEHGIHEVTGANPVTSTNLLPIQPSARLAIGSRAPRVRRRRRP
jgi:hypothetical protein